MDSINKLIKKTCKAKPQKTKTNVPSRNTWTGKMTYESYYGKPHCSFRYLITRCS